MLDGLTIDDIACLQALEQSELATLRNKEFYSIYLGVASNIAYFISFQFDIFTWASVHHSEELNVPLTYTEWSGTVNGVNQHIFKICKRTTRYTKPCYSFSLSTNPIISKSQYKSCPAGNYLVYDDKANVRCFKLTRSYIYNYDLLDTPVADLYLCIHPDNLPLKARCKRGG